MKHIYTFKQFIQKPLLVALALLAMSSNAWGAWAGSGSGTKKNGTWYVLYEDGEANIGSWGSKTYNLSGPGASLTFQAKRQAAGTANLQVTDNNGNSVFNSSLSTSYASKSGSVKNTATSLKFYNAGTLKKYFKTVHVTMAKYLENPSPETTASSRLDCGTADIYLDPTSKGVTVQWCNVPAMSYQIENDANNLFSVSVANNSEEGKYNTDTFTVSYKHTMAGTHTDNRYVWWLFKNCLSDRYDE